MGERKPSRIDFMSLFRLEEERRLAGERSARMIKWALHTVALALIIVFGVFAIGLPNPARDAFVALGVVMLLAAIYFGWKAWGFHKRSMFYAGKCTEMAFRHGRAISTVRRRLREMESQRAAMQRRLATVDDERDDAVLMEMVRELMAKAEQIPPGGMNK